MSATIFTEAIRTSRNDALCRLKCDGEKSRSMEPDALSQAYEQFRLGRFDVAERHCRTVLERNPDHAEINHLLGAIRFQQGNLEEALTLLKRATVSPGATAEHHTNLGCLLFKLGQ